MPGAHHRYHAGCPFCNDRRHDTAHVLLDVVEAATNLRSSAEECDGWDALQAALGRVLGAPSEQDAAEQPIAVPTVDERSAGREYGP